MAERAANFGKQIQRERERTERGREGEVGGGKRGKEGGREEEGENYVTILNLSMVGVAYF